MIKSVIGAFNLIVFPDLTLISGVLLLLLTSLYCIEKRKVCFDIKLVNIYPLALVASLVLWAYITTFWGHESSFSHIKTLRLLTILIPFIALYFYKEFELSYFSKIFIWFALGIFAFYFITSPKVVYHIKDQPLLLDYSGLQAFGQSGSLKAGIAVLLAIKFIKNIYFKASVVFILTFFTFYSTARGAFVFLAVILLIIIVSKFKQNIQYLQNQLFPRFQKVILLLVAITIGIFSIIHIDEHRSETLKRSFSRYGEWFKSKEASKKTTIDAAIKLDDLYHKKDKSTLTRIWHINYSLEKATESPSRFIFGHGFGSYGIMCCEKDKLIHPHNIFLELFIETGLIGVLLFMLFIYQLSKNAISKEKMFIISLCLLFYLLNMMKSWSIIEMRDFFTFAAILFFYENSNKSLNGKSLPHNQCS